MRRILLPSTAERHKQSVDARDLQYLVETQVILQTGAAAQQAQKRELLKLRDKN